LAKAKTPEERAEIEVRWNEISARREAKAKANAEAEAKADAAAQAEASKTKELLDLVMWSQKAVKARLKAPSTAKFAGTFLGLSKYKVYQMPSGSQRVYSWVDSQNGFGAMIRSQWMVEFKQNNSDWEIIRVVVE